jgi:hypothetical protein
MPLENRANSLAVVAVSTYLLLVGAWLLLTRQIPSPGFFRILRAMARPPFRGELCDIQSDTGFCSIAKVPGSILSDRESASSLMVFEDGHPLGPAHALHPDIRRLGGGRFSHWGDQIYFSASDGSDPRTNGRRYTVEEVAR